MQTCIWQRKLRQNEILLSTLVFNNLLVYKAVYRYALKNNSLDKICIQLGAQIEFG